MESAMKILTYPNPILSMPAKVVDVVDNRVRDLAEQMIERTKEVEGLGLAACQIGEPLAMFIFKENNEFWVAINPNVMKVNSSIRVEEEGCLSLPGIRAKIPRFNQVSVNFTDLGGIWHLRPVDSGTMAQMFQHEMDHLNGKLMWDNVSSLNRDVLRRRYKKVNKFKR